MKCGIPITILVLAHKFTELFLCSETTIGRFWKPRIWEDNCGAHLVFDINILAGCYSTEKEPPGTIMHAKGNNVLFETG